MIPKKIHYFWLGNKEKPKSVIKCINSWKKYCPDYEIIEWNDSNVDLDIMPFVRQAYDNKKYAFATDVLRLWAIYNYGGIYFDTDVELIKSYDNLLDNQGFIGFENKEYLNTGQCVGAEKENKIIGEMLDYYRSQNFVNEDGSFNQLVCTRVNTQILLNHGLVQNNENQICDGFAVYDSTYFNPYDSITGRLCKCSNTYSIHWYDATWNDNSKLYKVITQMLHRIFGTEMLSKLKK